MRTTTRGRASHLCLDVALAFALCLGCSGSGKPPESPADPAAEDHAAPVEEPKQVILPSGAKNVRKDDSIPDEYLLTEADCEALGKQYGAVSRSDQMAGVSPKLSLKQKEQAAASIDKVISKLETDWIDNCQRSLVGKAVDRATLNCAMGTKTVNEFKKCIGDEDAPSKPAGAPSKK